MLGFRGWRGRSPIPGRGTVPACVPWASGAGVPSRSTSSTTTTTTPPTPGVRAPGPFARRALVYVPGCDARKLEASRRLRPDTLVLDLEDSVPLARKEEARRMVSAELLRQVETGGDVEQSLVEQSVRINSRESGLDEADLVALLPRHHGHLHSLLLPKIHSADDIHHVTRLVEGVAGPEAMRTLDLIVSIESARGILHLRDIATAHPAVKALLFAAEDYCADVGCERTPSRQELLYARQAVVTAAKAYGLQAIDMVCVHFKQPEVLVAECVEGRQFGFTGKQAIHPAQIASIQEHFLPSPALVQRARAIIAGYAVHAAGTSGKGAFALDGQVVDMPVVKWAERILASLPPGRA